MLLEHSRSREVEPYGWLRLEPHTDPTLHRVPLHAKHFLEVERLIVAVRKARETGVEPRVCGCLVCNSREEVRKLVELGRDVRLISGIGREHQGTLHELGVTSIDKLVVADAVALADDMRAVHLNNISHLNVVLWKHHSRALIEDRPIRFSDEVFTSEKFVVLDLEYTPERPWLIGALHCDLGSGNEHLLQRWCPFSPQVRPALRKLQDFLDNFRDVPIVTFAGQSADLAMLRACTSRTKLTLLQDIERRHIDLYQLIFRTVRFPSRDHGLKTLGSYIGAIRPTKITSGLEAVVLYETYLRSQRRSQEKIERKLRQYNLDDLHAVLHLIKYLQRIPPNSVVVEDHNRVCSVKASRRRKSRAKVPFKEELARTGLGDTAFAPDSDVVDSREEWGVRPLLRSS